MQTPWSLVLVVVLVMDWAFTKGQRTSLVLSLICYDSQGNWHLLQSQDRRGYKLWVHGSIPHAGTIAGVDLLVTSEWPLHLEVDDASFVTPVPPCDRLSLLRVTDLCSGLGGFSVTAPRLGFTVGAGVDQNERWGPLFSVLHPDASFFCGDLMDTAVLRKLLAQGHFHGVVCSGIACQPHSVLGDRRGMADPRAQSPTQDFVCRMVVASGHFGPRVYPRSSSRCSGAGSPPSVLCLNRISDDSNHPEAGQFLVLQKGTDGLQCSLHQCFRCVNCKTCLRKHPSHASVTSLQSLEFGTNMIKPS